MNKLLKISRHFFLIIFLGFSVSVTFFNHAHNYYGNILIHSHPFKNDGSGNESHHHSWDEYLRIYLLNHYADDTLFSLKGLAVIRQLAEIRVTLKDSGILPVEFIHVSHLRGPPSLILNPDVR